MRKHVIDPDLFAETLGVPWFHEEPVLIESENETITFEDSYCFVLDGTKENRKMEAFFSHHTPDVLSISTNWSDEAGSGHVLLRNITRIVYQKEKRKVIIESKKGKYYSILEITRGTLHFPKVACQYVVQVNIDEILYQKEFKNYKEQQ